jgi:hypothetical protein
MALLVGTLIGSIENASAPRWQGALSVDSIQKATRNLFVELGAEWP